MVSLIYINQGRIGFPMIIVFKIKTEEDDFGGKDRYITLALERVVEIKLSFNFLVVLNCEIYSIIKTFFPDPCLTDKGTTVLGQNISHKQQNMFKNSPTV